MHDILNKKSGRKLAEKIAKEADVKLHDCYQCGKCTAGCPMAHAMDIMPRQLVHYMKLGQNGRDTDQKGLVCVPAVIPVLSVAPTVLIFRGSWKNAGWKQRNRDE